jgi:hypothetical protein
MEFLADVNNKLKQEKEVLVRERDDAMNALQQDPNQSKLQVYTDLAKASEAVNEPWKGSSQAKRVNNQEDKVPTSPYQPPSQTPKSKKAHLARKVPTPSLARALRSAPHLLNRSRRARTRSRGSAHPRRNLARRRSLVDRRAGMRLLKGRPVKTHLLEVMIEDGEGSRGLRLWRS